MGKLKGIAHDLAHSFTSLMNFDPSIDNYVMEYLAYNMAKMGVDKVEIELMSMTITPPELALRPILESMNRYRNFLRYLLSKTRWTLEDVQTAKIVIRRTGKRKRFFGSKWHVYEAFGEIVLKNGQVARSKIITSHWLEKI